jgi:class 3 adenylate cyclase
MASGGWTRGERACSAETCRRADSDVDLSTVLVRSARRVDDRRVDGLPTGTVTMLFSDIEGSTSLLARLGQSYADALDAHRVLLRSAWARWGGVEMGTEGDSFFVVFRGAADAVRAALQAQHAVAAHTWPASETVALRMGLHTGEPVPHNGGYVGMDVHRAARLSAAAHGGQFVISEAT